MFIFSPRPLYNEVKIMLMEEFGGEYRTLFGECKWSTAVNAFL